ncbi:hypothetical protein D3C86_898670 [compost metagenome]
MRPPAMSTCRRLGPDQSERLRLGPNDITRYAGACVRFWGLGDRDDFATAEPPYD